jgi:hypothetical protein
VDGHWLIRNSGNGSASDVGWGVNGDQPVPDDYDGDYWTDPAQYKPSTGHWLILNSRNGSVSDIGWGVPGDVPV